MSKFDESACPTLSDVYKWWNFYGSIADLEDWLDLQTDDYILELVRFGVDDYPDGLPFIFRWKRNPSEYLQTAVVAILPTAIDYIKKPCEDALFISLLARE